ncbi:aspartate aminotransferase family protein [Chloroflexota bacterium]
MTTSRTEELKKRSLKHIFHCHGRVPEISLILEKGKGIMVTDTDGKEYMDLCSFYGCSSLGYCNDEIIDTAYKAMKQMSFNSTNVPYSSIPAIEYSETLAKFVPKNITRFQFCSGGSESVETAIKTIKAYWYIKGKASKYKVLCTADAFHGSFYLTGTLMGNPIGRNYFGPEAPGVVRVPHYHCHRCPFHLKYPDCGVWCAHYLEKIIVDEEGADSIAAFIAEPMHSWAGGEPVPEYFPIVREILTKHDILFIDDETVTGFCRTGKNFGIDHWNVQPDLMIMGKGMIGGYFPFAGVGISEEVYSVFPGTTIITGLTNTGNAVGCAIAKAVLDIYIRDNMVEHVAKVGNHVKERLEKEFRPLPHVANVAGLGLNRSIELIADKETKRRFPENVQVIDHIIKQCRAKGLFVRSFSTFGNMEQVFFMPPLIITQEQVDSALDRLYSILSGLKDLR